jgi:hypothetical protein
MDPGVFRRAAHRSGSLPVGYRSWTLAHPRGSRSRLGPCVGPGRRRPVPLHVHPPLRFVSPSALPAPGIHFPAWCVPPVLPAAMPWQGSGRAVSAHASTGPPCLVAGFHARFGPPPPFPATLAACSSRCPVAYFGHSHPWGSFSRFPARLPARSDPRAVPSERGGRAFGTRLSRPSRTDGAGAEARVPSAMGTAASAAVATAPASGPPRPVALRVAGLPPGCPDVRLLASPSWLRSKGCLPRTVPISRPRVTAAGDRSRRERIDRVQSARTRPVPNDPPALTTVAPLGVPVAHVCRLRPPHPAWPRRARQVFDRRVPAPRTRMKL